MVVGTEGASTILPGDVAANILVVRPEQVAGVIRWNDELADRPARRADDGPGGLRRRPGAGHRCPEPSRRARSTGRTAN